MFIQRNDIDDEWMFKCPITLVRAMFVLAEAFRTTVKPITPLIHTTVVPISGVIGPTVVWIANATGIGYRHDGSMRFSNKLNYMH